MKIIAIILACVLTAELSLLALPSTTLSQLNIPVEAIAFNAATSVVLLSLIFSRQFFSLFHRAELQHTEA